MQQLLKLLESLTAQLKAVVVQRNAPTVAGQKLCQTALTFIGRDASPRDVAPDEYACVESVEQIHFATFGEYIGGGVSTLRLYHALKNHKKFVQVTLPLPGDLILSPTGLGGKNGITNGHVGICGPEYQIMSNSSEDGVWKQNYTFWSWKYRYATLGSYPLLLFRRII